MDFNKTDRVFLIYLIICSIAFNTDALNECESNPCQNGATCVDGPYGYYTCLCTENWHGQNCASQIPSHIKGPCQSGNFYNYTGEILSDDYPDVIPNRLKCFMLIRIHGAETINITFNMFDMEERRDAIYFGYGYEIPSDKSHFVNWTNGDLRPPEVFTFNGSAAWIMVETNKLIESQGYNLSISADGNDCIDKQCTIGICGDLIRDFTCPCYRTCLNGGECNLHGECDCPQNISTGLSCESEIPEEEDTTTESYDDNNEDDDEEDDSDSKNGAEGLSTIEVVLAGGGVLAVIVLINLVMVVVCCRSKSCNGTGGGVSREPISSISPQVMMTEQNRYSEHEGPQTEEPPYSACKDAHKFPAERLHGLLLPENKIGNGSSGVVHRVDAVGIIEGQHITPVAVKMIRASATDHDKKNFSHELEIMVDIPFHPNIIRLLGHSITDNGSTCIIMEYSPKTLQGYLSQLANERRQSVSSEQLLRFGVQIAKAMEHLALQKIVHRDLAARNILLGSGLQCKVADFGLSRHLDDDQEEYIMMSHTRVPVRWMAPESLNHDVYTTKSDVWSFAVLMWEILTLGARPYTGMSSREVKQAISMGYRLPRPEHCSQTLYGVMLHCWQDDPSERPTFSEIKVQLENMMTSAYINIVMDSFDGTHYEYTEIADLEINDDINEDYLDAVPSFDTRRLFHMR